MSTTTTESKRTVRQAMKQIRRDAEDWGGYLPGGGPRYYWCDQGVLQVRNAATSDGRSLLLGVFEVELVNDHGTTIRKYKV